MTGEGNHGGRGGGACSQGKGGAGGGAGSGEPRDDDTLMGGSALGGLGLSSSISGGAVTYSTGGGCGGGICDEARRAIGVRERGWRRVLSVDVRSECVANQLTGGD